MHRIARTVGVAAVVAAAVAVGMSWADGGPEASCDRTPVAANRGGDGDTEIALYDRDGVRSLTPDMAAASPSFSPDGDHLVFVRGDAGWADAGPLTTELRIVSVHDGARSSRNLLRDEGLRYDPAWSPKQDLIAYVERSGDDRILRVVETSGLNPTTLLEKDGADLIAPSWSPDGEQLAFIERRFDGSDHAYEIGILDLGTDELRPVAPFPDASGLSWTPDASALLVSTDAAEDGTIALLDLASGTRTTIAEHATKATMADATTVFYLDRVGPAKWQLAVGHIDDDRLVHDRHIGDDVVYNYGHFGVAAAPCPA